MHTRLAGTLPVILDLYMVLISPILVKSQIGLNTIKSLVVKKKKKKPICQRGLKTFTASL